MPGDNKGGDLDAVGSRGAGTWVARVAAVESADAGLSCFDGRTEDRDWSPRLCLR